MVDEMAATMVEVLVDYLVVKWVAWLDENWVEMMADMMVGMSVE